MGLKFNFNALSGTRGYVYADNANNIGFLDSDADWLVKGTKDAGVELYYDNSKKFITTSDGAEVNNGFLTIYENDSTKDKSTGTSTFK